MISLEKKLAAKLKGAGRIVFLGIGSELRGDDSAGIVFINRLRKVLRKSPKKTRISLLLGSSAPENLTGKIKDFKPTHIVMVDAAAVGERPGVIRLLTPEASGNAMFSTHTLPLSVMAEYLKNYLDSSIIIVGIRPDSLAFGKDLSPSVSLALDKLVRIIDEAVL